MPGRRAPAEPIIDELALPSLTPAGPEALRTGGHYEALLFTDADLSRRDLSAAAFSECEFLGLDASETQLRDARFIETRIERLQAPAFTAQRSFWRDVHLRDSRLGAVEMHDAELRAVRFAHSKLSFVNLRAAELRDVRFDHCIIEELDLSQVQAERLAFRDCTIGTIRFDSARLRHVDLRGLELRSLSGVDSMSGTILSTSQALDLSTLFAEHLGITVREGTN